MMFLLAILVACSTHEEVGLEWHKYTVPCEHDSAPFTLELDGVTSENPPAIVQATSVGVTESGESFALGTLYYFAVQKDGAWVVDGGCANGRYEEHTLESQVVNIYVAVEKSTE